MIIISSIGLLANLIMLKILGGHGHSHGDGHSHEDDSSHNKVEDSHGKN